MKASRFTEAQIITILREAEAGQTTIEALCRKYAIGEATFYRWRSKYGGVDASQAMRLKDLERENARLKKLLAERDLEIEVMKEVNAKKWSAHTHVGRRCTSLSNAACRVDVRVRCFRLRGQHYITEVGSTSAMLHCRHNSKRLPSAIRVMATDGHGRWCALSVVSSISNGYSASGALPCYRYRVATRADGLLAAACGHWLPPARTRCGRMTFCMIAAPTGKS